VRLALAFAAACGNTSSPKVAPQAADDARRRLDATASRDAGAGRDATAGAGSGELTVRVEWRDAPLVARASPGRSPCGTPLAGAVAPTTTWGIPDVFVIVDAGPRGTDEPSRVVLDRCALAPRAVVTAGGLAVNGTGDAPAALVLTRRGELRDPAALVTGPSRRVMGQARSTSCHRSTAAARRGSSSRPAAPR
jgi:hypothetical protein